MLRPTAFPRREGSSGHERGRDDETHQRSHGRGLNEASRVPFIAEVEDLAAFGLIPADSSANRNFYERAVTVENGVEPFVVDLLADAQTSGGLLISVAESAKAELHAALERRQVPHHEIDRVIEKSSGRIRSSP